VLFPVTVASNIASVVYLVSPAFTNHFVTGLTPGAGYAVAVSSSAGMVQITVSAGGTAQFADNAGVLAFAPALPPQMGQPTFLGNGTLQLTGTGTAGSTYSVRATTNIASATSWVLLGTAQTDAQGHISFTDQNAAGYRYRFYRFSLP
jgi:hypothetical protein